MLKYVNFKSFWEDLRKLGITFIIGGLIGLFLRPHGELVPLVMVTVIGFSVWYLGLRDGGD